jgi:hypothetical protein
VDSAVAADDRDERGAFPRGSLGEVGDAARPVAEQRLAA